MRAKVRPGFTLVELLVVITIIGILAGLVLPAVNAAREAARRTQCTSYQRSLSQAALSYETIHGHFPGYMQDFGSFAGGTDPSDPAGGQAPAHIKIGTWAVALMPQLDSQPIYELWSDDQYPVVVDASHGQRVSPGNMYHKGAVPNLAFLACPSDTLSADEDFGANSYVSNNGFFPGAALDAPPPQSGAAWPAAGLLLESFEAPNGVFNNKVPITTSNGTELVGGDVSIDSIKDGKTQTLLFSENLQAMPWYQIGLAGTVGDELVSGAGPATVSAARLLTGMTWEYFDDQGAASPGKATPPKPPSVIKINGGLANGTDRYNLFMDDFNGADKWQVARPSSAHSGGVVMSFADGSTKFVDENLDYFVYQALMTPHTTRSEVPFTKRRISDDDF